MFHFIVLAMLGVGVLAFAAHRASLRDAYYRILSAVQGGVAGGPVQTSGHVGIAATDLPEGGRFLPKPYGPTDVAGVLREVAGG